MSFIQNGSYNASSLPQSSTSSWAVTLRDRWLDQNFNSVPSDEREVAAHLAHSAGAILYTCTRGIYPAELQAIARSLAMFPLLCSLHIHSCP
jgi:hypothetical protein